jgi:hypothetical protein
MARLARPLQASSQLRIALADPPHFDPVGRDFCLERPAAERRAFGITLTPEWLVNWMLDRCAAFGDFDCIVDPGCGTARFASAAARRWPRVRVIGVESQQELAALARDVLANSGLNHRVEVAAADYRCFDLPRFAGRTLFIGNPPYVRHHDIAADWKIWYREQMARQGIAASALAGLHAHFFLKTALLARPGDAFCFVVPAEWLDSGYGAALRRLLGSARLPVSELWLADKGTAVFDDALVSTVVVAGVVGEPAATVRLGILAEYDARPVRNAPRASLAASARWSELWHEERPHAGRVEVGELFAVKRGQVTGNNPLWIHGVRYRDPLPAALLRPTVTRARELLDLPAAVLDDATSLRRVIDVPPDWREHFTGRDALHIERFIEWLEREGGRDSYIARHRTPWYRVRLGEPAPILMTYMARRAPRFVRNAADAAILNIAHGLYPRQGMMAAELDAAVAALNRCADRRDGRTYAGNLVKFEPGDAMRMRFSWALD